jgi:hypothetical protein
MGPPYIQDQISKLSEPGAKKGSNLPSTTSSPYPKECELCHSTIESADDTEWHGYGNCVEITPEMEEEWRREAEEDSTK